MGSKVSTAQLQWIASIATNRKEQAVADLDFEEAAMWRDAKDMALELEALRDQLGEGSVSYGELKAIGDYRSIATNSTVAWIARELVKRMDAESARTGVWPVDAVVEQLKELQEPPTPTEPSQ
jgi:hypothetical protein